MQLVPFPVAGVLLAAVAFAGAPAHRAPAHAAEVSAKLSEWKVELSEDTIAVGTVTFRIANTGSIPHAFEVEGQGIEKKSVEIQPGSSVALTLTLKPGTYEVYCPEAEDSHKMLGMETHLTVVGGKGSGSSAYGDAGIGASHVTAMSEALPMAETVRSR
jgi:uncharacterized cupredoxin-like copper-binding protein